MELRRSHCKRAIADTAAPAAFLALTLIALSYTAATVIGAWAFLAVFAAGIGLRHAEVRTVRDDPHPEAEHTPAQDPPSRRDSGLPQWLCVAHGVPTTDARELADLTISVVAVSIVVHELSSQPLMIWYERRRSRRAGSR